MVKYELHFVDDSEIKEGDWIYNSETEEIIQCIGKGSLRNWKKILASTDKSLKLPSPSEQFIRKFLESYNKGNVITDVMIEWEDYWIPVAFSLDVAWRVKVDSKNEITITKCKDSYSKEELKQLFDSYGDNIPAKIIWKDIQNL